jgi:hypothetical protein
VKGTIWIKGLKMPPKARIAQFNRRLRGILDHITKIEIKKPDSIQNLASEEGDEKLKIISLLFQCPLRLHCLF